MSVSPDDPSFLNSLLGPNGSLANGMNSPLMGLAMGLLQAGGPSRMPTSFGQALGQGMQTGQQFQSAGIQNAMQKLQLQQALQGQQYFQGLLGGGQQSTGLPPQPNAQTSQAPATMGTAVASATNGLTAPQNAQLPAKPQLPALMDPTQDQQYLALQKQAMIAKHFGLDSTAYDNQAKARIDNLTAQEITLSPEQAKLLTNGNILPGQTVKFKPYTGDWTIAGEPKYKDITYQDGFSGQTLHARMDQTTGAVVPFKLPGNGPQQGDMQLQDEGGAFTVPKNWVTTVRKVAQGDENMPALTSKNPQLANNLTRAATALNPDWRAGDAPAKVALMKSATAQGDAKTLDSYNTIQSHLNTLQKAWDALQNGDIQTANQLTNWAGAKFGKDAPTNAKLVNDLVSSELAKVLVGEGKSTNDARAEASSGLSSYFSQNQQKGAIGYIRNLIGGKTNATLQRYKANGLENYLKARLEPDALQAMNDFQQQSQGNPQAAGRNPNLAHLSDADLLKQLGAGGG